MPSCPRGDIVRDGEVGVYHCYSRCVRRAYLCGNDPVTGKDFEYRRDWICQFEEALAGLFGIEVAFHGELSNHIHLILRSRPDVVALWSDKEVVRRWLTISHLVPSKDGQTIKELTDVQIAMEMADPRRVDKLRRRLASVSFFMGALCEHIARRSNMEDCCRGSFWDGRFKCQDLADEGAILVCGIYIDLNQIRAGEALTPETSLHTSACDRIIGRRQRLAAVAQGMVLSADQTADGWLCELTLEEGLTADVRKATSATTHRRASDKGLLPITVDEYLQLLDTSGRMVREGKTGAIPDHLAPILSRLGVTATLWGQLITEFDQWFGLVVGKAQRLTERAVTAGRRWYCGRSRCADAFG